MLPSIFRKVNPVLVSNRKTYLPGMVLVRLSRKIKKLLYNPSSKPELREINNFMGKIRMVVDKNSYMGGSIYWTGFHHLNELLFLKSFLKPDMTFIDIGSNQGEFSLFAASILKSGRVISFEPVTRQLDFFKRNIQLNGFNNIEVHHYGLSDKEGEFDIFTSDDSKTHGGFHEGLSTLYPSDSRSVFEERIKIKVFDKEFQSKINRIDFIKIDIEGSELFALKGMQEHIKAFHPMILIEMSEETCESAGYTLKDLTTFLYSFGYKAYRIHRGRLIENGDDFGHLGNYIFK